MEKDSVYLLKLNSETNQIFDLFNEKLGWGKKETVVKLLHFFKDIVAEIDSNHELRIALRDETTKEIVKERVASYNFIRNHS